jgi:hypothetical protein
VARREVMPRVGRDIDALMTFVGSWPRGQPAKRLDELQAAMEFIAANPELRPVTVRRRVSKLELRRYNVRQFAVIYHYYRPSERDLEGLVSFRAVRHSRVADVFRGVREEPAAAYAVGHAEAA